MAWARAAEADRGKPLVELLELRFRDRIARRRVERQLADIADTVTERLVALCGHEYRDLTDGDRQAAIREVVRTMTAADLSDEALLAADADPVKLARRVRAELPRREAWLGEAGDRLYEVVLDECCDYLVRIVRELPRFEGQASAETPSRLSGLADQVGTVLARLPARSLDAPAGTADDEEFGRRYLEHVSDTLDSAELFGVRVERYRPRTALSVAYVSLNVSMAAADARRRRGGRPPRIADWREPDDEPEHATVRVEAALSRSRLMLVRGEAGSGKSTMLRWLAVTAARGVFRADLAGWNGCVPFLIKLRRRADGELPPPEQFLDEVADPIAGLMPAGWAHRLAAGPADRGRLSVRTPSQYAALRHLRGLRSLLVQVDRAPNLDLLADHAATLAHLEVFAPDCPVDVSPLAQLGKLSELRLRAPGLTDVSFVRDLPPLRTLALAELEQVTDFSPLAAHTALEALWLNDCPALSDLDVLPPLGNLRELDLSGSSLACGLQRLVDEIPNVEMLRLYHTDWVRDLAPLAALSLRTLGCGGARPWRTWRRSPGRLSSRYSTWRAPASAT